MRFKRKGQEHTSLKRLNSDRHNYRCLSGSRGAFPERDILIKYQENGKRLRTPKHIHWVIDLLIKKEHNRDLTIQFMKYLRIMYDKVHAFKDEEDRKKCFLSETTSDKLNPFKELDRYGDIKLSL